MDIEYKKLLKNALRMILSGSNSRPTVERVAALCECDEGRALEMCRMIGVKPTSHHYEAKSARQQMAELLERCTPGQVGRFNKMYGSVKEIKRDQMKWAFQQIERTLEQTEVSDDDS